ncbi:hypothetical protein NB814_00865 [Latilactobacillus curvatus]|uniref:phage tail spike protein n=1 Tax=Latilactobacillus curvatus TaxID=28038 RepID=UPI00202F4325|nr:phage tail spike protein [Latilactobacillus curvatus]MCM0724304.1 hypothetical protein [Latilactobacillus curvatus]
MEWFILSRDLHVLCVPSSDSKDSLPIFNDKQTIVLQNNTVVSTYDFSVQQKHPDAINLKWGNYVVFRDKYGKTRMYTLISHDGDDLTQTWHAEDIGLDLLNETADKWDYTGELHGIDWYFNNLVLKDTGWSIGINEISNLTRGLKFDGQSDTQLKRLGDIANQFDGAEIDFEVALDGSRVTKQVVNIYKKVGNPMTQQRFIDAVNLKSLQSSGSIEDLCTAMIGYGSQPDIKDGENAEDVPPIDFADLSYDDGQFFSPKGDKAVYDRLNHLVWSRYSGFDTTNQNETKGYITGIYNYETKDSNELLNRTITQLKKRNAPSETYEANLLDINADIGDEVQIAHNQYNPPIYLSARVEQVENCYTTNGQDTGVLGDYRKLESDIDPRIKEMLNALENQIKSHYMWIRYAEDDKGKGMTSVPTVGTEYIAILANKPTAIPSDDPADYAGHWQLIKGSDGKDGIPGATGADGKTSYTHFAYADNVSGTKDFSTDDPTGRSYMGVYSDFTKADSNNPSDYVWSYTKGETGPEGTQGIPGKPGADGKTPYTHVAYADNDEGGGFSQSPDNKAYMGWYSDFTANDSNDPSQYAWSLIKGADGKDGAQGIPGKPGADGKSSYTHIAYADSATGGGFSQQPDGKAFIGMYVDFEATDSTDVTKYNWSLVKGEDGSDGTPGKAGADGKTPYFHIAYADSADGKDGFYAGGGTNLLSNSRGKFKPNKSTADNYIVYTDSAVYMVQGQQYTVHANASPGLIWSGTHNPGEESSNVVLWLVDGANVNVIVSDTNTGTGTTFTWGYPSGTYYLRVNTYNSDNSGFVENVMLEKGTVAHPWSPAPSEAHPIYMGTYTDFTQADSLDPTAYSWTQVKGADGANGAPGKPGADGRTPYFHQAWADSKDGNVNFSTTDPSNRGYLGTYTDFTQADSTDPSKYFWVELVGALGIGTPNLIYNAGFKGSGDSVGSDGWTTPPGGWVSRPSTRTGYSGSNGLVINVNQISDSWQVISARRVAVQDYNQPYSFAARVSLFNESTGIDRLYCELGMYDNDNKWLGGRQTNWLDLSKKDTYQLLMSEDAGLIEGTAFIQFRLAVHANASGRVYACISQPILNASDRVAPFSDNQATGADITQINNALSNVNGKIDAVTKVDSQATAPTNPKKGDQWWVKDANGNINAFKIWDGTQWAPSTITQSLLVIKELDAININGSVINGSRFTNAFTFKSTLDVNYTGVTTIADGAVKITYKIPSTNEIGTTQITAEGYKQELFNSSGSRTGLSMLSPNSLQLETNGVGGFLTPDDLIRYGPESWSNSDAGGTYTIAFERRWGRVWVTGELLLPASSFGDYHTLFTIKTPGLRPQKNRWFVGMRTGNVPVAGEIEMRPNGEFVVIGVPQGGRHTFEGVSYSLGNE